MLPANSSQPAPGSTERSFGWLITGIGVISFGCMLLVLAVAFARDLKALRDAPGILWSALCGQPVQSALTLPLLLAAGVIALLAGAGIVVIGRIRGRHPSHT